MLKAAQIATLEPGPDAGKRIEQRHFVQGMESVVAAERVMAQSLYEATPEATAPAAALARARDRLLFAIAVAALAVSLIALGVSLARG